MMEEGFFVGDCVSFLREGYDGEEGSDGFV